jgi:hypothetical protein
MTAVTMEGFLSSVRRRPNPEDIMNRTPKRKNLSATRTGSLARTVKFEVRRNDWLDRMCRETLRWARICPIQRGDRNRGTGNIVDYTNADGERFVVTADGTAISYFSDGRIGAVVPPNADINRFLIDTVTGGAAAALLGSQIRVARLVPRGLPTEINSQLQARHASGTVGRRSPLLEGVDAQALLDGVHSGAYNVLRINQRGYPVVDFGGPIGMYRGQQTQFGTIHFGKNGAHIVPANPVQY